MKGEWDEWELEVVEQAREKLRADPSHENARKVLEEFAAGKQESFSWFLFPVS